MVCFPPQQTAIPLRVVFRVHYDTALVYCGESRMGGGKAAAADAVIYRPRYTVYDTQHNTLVI